MKPDEKVDKRKVAEYKKKGWVDQDSEAFHRETLDAEDEIFAALDRVFGSNNID